MTIFRQNYIIFGDWLKKLFFEFQLWILGPMAPEWLIAPQSPITCRFAIKNSFKRGTTLSCSVLRFWVISEKPHFLAKNDTFWLIYLVTLFAPQSPFNHNLPMQNAFKWGIALPCSALRFPISSLSKGHVHCAAVVYIEQ